MPVLSTFTSSYSYPSPFPNLAYSSPEGYCQGNTSITVDTQIGVNSRPVSEVVKQIDELIPQVINSFSERSRDMGTHKRKEPEASSLSTKEYSELRISNPKKIKNTKTKEQWKKDEDQLLLQLHSKGKTWKEIAIYFENRTAGACKERRKRIQESEEIGNVENSTGHCSRWTAKQIIHLLKTAIETNHKWKKVALLMKKQFPDAPRTKSGCRIQFKITSFLQTKVKETGQDWEKVAKLMKKQFPKRTRNALIWRRLWEEISPSLFVDSSPSLLSSQVPSIDQSLNYSSTSFRAAESETILPTDQENVLLQDLNPAGLVGETNSILSDSVIDPSHLEFVNSCFNSNV